MKNNKVAVPAREKTLEEMTSEDKKAMAHMLEWQGIKLVDCGRLELIDCIIHMTAQVVYLQGLREREIAARTKIARIR